MLKDVVEVQPLDGYRLKLRFEDGAEGVVDVAELVPFTGVFAPLHDRDEFVSVRVNPELAAYLGEEEGEGLDELQRRIQRKVTVQPAQSLHKDEYEIIAR